MKNENLHSIKSTGFKTPEDYFESLEDAVFSKMKEQKIHSNVGFSGFKVPSGYFEDFDSKVLSLVAEDKSKVISLFDWKKIAYISGIAASLILVFNLLFTNSDQLTFDDLETASIENYLINEDLNSYEIAPYLGTADLNADNFVENKLNASDIEDYLLQNSNVDYLISD